jgi:hypothetical protein
MTSKFFERRSLRNQLKTHLDKKGWTDLNWAEGFSAYTLPDIELPFIAVFLEDFGKVSLEMGNDPSKNKLFQRRAQVTVFMESEDRVDALTDEIADFLDLEVIIIKDNSNSILGSLVSSTDTILSATADPTLDPELLEWSGHVTCMYEAFYP